MSGNKFTESDFNLAESLAPYQKKEEGLLTKEQEHIAADIEEVNQWIAQHDGQYPSLKEAKDIFAKLYAIRIERL